MGLETAHILSEERHHGPFICAICQNLCGLDALITTACSHVFCRLCLETWLTRRIRMDDNTSTTSFAAAARKTCPTCNSDLAYGCFSSKHMNVTEQSGDSSNGRRRRRQEDSMMIGGQTVHAQPLSEAQPLAHRLLQRVNVSCPLRVDHGCKWTGDYADLQDHLVSLTAHSSSSEPPPGLASLSNTDAHSTKPLTEAKDDAPLSLNDTQNYPHNDSSLPTTTQDSHHKQQSRTQTRKLAESFKEEANGRYATENYNEAKDLYTKALTVLMDNGDGDDIISKSNNLTSTATTTGECTKIREVAATLYANRAICHFKLGSLRLCVDDSSTAIKINKHYVKAYIRQASALAELGNFEEACNSLEEGIRDNPQSSLLKNELKSSRTLRDGMRKGMEELQAGEFASAKSTFGLLLRKTGAVSVIIAAARADLGLGLTDSALRLSLKVIRSSSNNGCNVTVEGYEVRGQCMYLMGDFDKALTVFREAVRLDPDYTRAKTLLRKCKKVGTEIKEARQAAFRRRFEEAVDRFTTALEEAKPLSPNAPLYCILHSERAEAYLRLKQFELALKDCSLVIYAREDFESAWIFKAKALSGLGRHEEARDEMSDLLNKWGSGNEAIRNAFNKADFEVRKKNRPDFYALLGVPTIASEMEIKKQYKVRALELHPDRFCGDKYTDSQRENAEEQFKLMGEGLEILCDDFKRQLYDEGYDQAAIKERVAAAQQAAHRRSGGHNGYHHGYGHH